MNWATFGQYEASFHTHTTESDGSQTPAQVIDDYYFESDGRLVWGYSNDDKYTTGHLYRNFQFMWLPELSEAALRAAAFRARLGRR